MHTTNVKEMRIFFDALSSGKPAHEIYQVVLSYLHQRKAGVDANAAAKQAKLELESKAAREAAEQKAKDDAARKAKEAAEAERLAARPRRPADDNLDVIIDDSNGDEILVSVHHKAELAKAASVSFDFSMAENLKLILDGVSGAALPVKANGDGKFSFNVQAKGEFPVAKLVVADKSNGNYRIGYSVEYLSAEVAEQRARSAAAAATTTSSSSSSKISTTTTTTTTTTTAGEAPEEEDEIQQITPALKMIIKSKSNGYEIVFENSGSTTFGITMDFAKSTNLKVEAGPGATLDGAKVTVASIGAGTTPFASLTVADFALGECELVYSLSKKEQA